MNVLIEKERILIGLLHSKPSDLHIHCSRRYSILKNMRFSWKLIVFLVIK